MNPVPALRLATEAEKDARDALNHEAWGALLTVDQWLQREASLRAHPWSVSAMKTWLWVENPDGPDGGEVLSSCETFEVPSTFGGVEGRSFGIASVYTEPRLRGRGYATQMLTALHQQLRSSGQAAYLFSDVGAGIYRRAGYAETPAWDWIVEVRPPVASHAKPLFEEEVRRALSRIRAADGRYSVAVSAAQLDWHLQRERVYAYLLDRARPIAIGATEGESTAIWAAVYRENHLAVLLFDARTEGDARVLLNAARWAAHSAGLTSVKVWDVPGLPPLPPYARKAPREGSLPMIAPLGCAVTPADWRAVPRALWI